MARLLFIADPPAALNAKGDTSLALAEAALESGHEVRWCTPTEINLVDHTVTVAHSVSLLSMGQHEPEWGAAVSSPEPLHRFDTYLIRKDPPFDTAYTSFCWMLSLESRTLGINPPGSLLKFHEKTLQFAAVSEGVLTPDEVIPTLVTRSADTVAERLEQWQSEGNNRGFIVKPWLGYGGRGVIHAPTISTALKIWTAENQNALMMVQPFDPAIHTTGDVRVILAGNQIIGSFSRLPTEGRVASNLAQGGEAVPFELSLKQRNIMQRVADFQMRHGIRFSGLDLIGNRINEINITSPTGLRSLQHFGLEGAARQALSEMLS